jgi:hypothetical protein
VCVVSVVVTEFGIYSCDCPESRLYMRFVFLGDVVLLNYYIAYQTKCILIGEVLSAVCGPLLVVGHYRLHQRSRHFVIESGKLQYGLAVPLLYFL